MEKIDNITNEIMDRLRDVVDRIDLKHYINNNTDEDIGDLDDEVYSIIHNELKKEVSFDQNSLSQDRPYIRHKTSVLKQEIKEAKRKLNEAKKSKISSVIDEASRELDRVSEELELRKDIASPNTRN